MSLNQLGEKTLCKSSSPLLKYRIYEALLKGTDEKIRFCISSVRETSFREEVKKGKYSIDLLSMKLQSETLDRNLARSLATEF